MQLGLWLHDPCDPDSEAQAALGQDGVLLTKPHQQYVSGLQWLPDGTCAPRLASSSYDGAVLLSDAAVGKFSVVRYNAADEISAMACRDSHCILTGDNVVCPLLRCF
jgi:WD40 repeat protein